ncbi:PREDICTED: probable chitinase 2 [Papilio polytes]|uniref:probable chitinase 2 n=1 Tax=Papilio polytes TaxID=76194 RepID=UPI000675FBA5|nr:PREDICTED: probable chitinase 2 [Papilio polytes]
MVKLQWIAFLIGMVSVLDGQTLGGPMHGKVVVCYIGTWATYRPGDGQFDLEHLEPSLCTHIVYSFAGLDETTMGIKSLDSWHDLEKNNGSSGYRGLVALKRRYPHLKVTIAIGGWNEGSRKFSAMAETAESRTKFIKSVLVFLDVYKFDGLDLDWEYPAKRDGRPIDRANFVLLVKELKEAFEPKNYLLTAALGAGKETMDAAYDMHKLSRYLDFIHMMCYDYHGTWDGVVGANAPLRGTSDDDVLSVEYTIKYLLENGVSPYKMVLGVPLYGRTFILNDDAQDIEFGRTTVQQTGFKGPYTREAGFMGYNEICMEITNKSSKWTHHWHDQSATPYLRDGKRIITYDNTRSIAIKVKTAMEYNLGGIMVWSIDTDDFRGLCEKDREAETYHEFVQSYNRIVDDPILKKALKSLNLPDAGRIENLVRQRAYVVANNKLQLRLPAPQYSNYALMHAINDATTLALEEKRILDEMNRVMKQNEIPDEPDSASYLSISLFTVICYCITFLLRL